NTVSQKEPVATPGDIAADVTEAVDRHCHVMLVNIGGNVLDRHRVAPLERCGNHADRGFDVVNARSDAPHIGKGDNCSDRAVAAHAEIAGIVVKYQPGRAARIGGFAQKGADDRLKAARLIEREAPDLVEAIGKNAPPFRQPAGTKLRTALDHKSRWLSLRVRIDDLHRGLSIWCRPKQRFEPGSGRSASPGSSKSLRRDNPPDKKERFGRLIPSRPASIVHL